MTKEIFDNENSSLEGYGTYNIYNGERGRQKQHSKNNSRLENEKGKNTIKNLKTENPNLSFEVWSNTLKDKRQILEDKVNEYFPETTLELDFILSIKTILNIEDITLPFMGIVFAVPSSMKTKIIELLRKWIYSYLIDKFTAKSFVSHSATVAKEQLSEIDLLPRIKDKIVLTPELSPLFTAKEEDIKEQFGIITRILDGNGLETESGVHGKRGYYGDYMFVRIGAAVDIPHNIYKYLATIGFKIYFLRLPRSEISEDDLVEQTTTEIRFTDRIKEIEKFLIDYLNWFEICPISIGLQNLTKIEWDKSKDNKNAIRIIARLAILLAHLRGNIYVYKTSDHEDLIPIESTHNTGANYSEGFIHTIPTIENPSRANQQLYNLGRGHALSHGRNYITMDDIPLIIKVVLSTGSIERVLILDLLIANKGILTTSQITTAMRISNNPAKRTMTEFKGLELVTMERTNNDNSNSEYKITLNPKFKWFLSEEFKKLRDNFKPTNNKEHLKSQKKSNTFSDSYEENSNNKNRSNNENDSQICCDENTPCVFQKDDIKTNSNKSCNIFSISSISNNNYNNDTVKNREGKDSHRGKISQSKITNDINQQEQVFAGKCLKFNTPLISASDMDTAYDYQPEIINNIDRFEGTDRWFCKNCTLKGDKWFMMKNPCNNNNNKNNFNQK